MGKTREDFKEYWPTVLIIGLGIGLTSLLTQPFADFFESTGLPLWSLPAFVVAFMAFLFAVDIRAAHKRGERYSLRASKSRARRENKPGVPTQRTLESRAKLK